MPRSASGKPVESRGSITPAADGTSAHASPTTRRLRKATRGECLKGSVVRAERNCASTDGRHVISLDQALALSDAFTAVATGSVSAAPALVTPLLNRSIQIQPPGKTWCSAAESTG